MHNATRSVKSVCMLNSKSLGEIYKCVLNVSLHQRTPLYMAVEEGQLDVVKYLFCKGADSTTDINFKDNQWVNMLTHGLQVHI